MSKPKNSMRRVNDIVFDTNSRWKRIRLTLIELVVVLAILFMICYAHHLVEVLAQ